ncbi:MAG: Mut7-C RNAse domain-containing protein [Nitrospirae bacterium]|nr:Mut7-C RNAse domain-containing protein [Nitrospirota bacterium]
MPDSPFQPPSPLAFFADAMLGRLARWLRILGYDTAYEKVITDEELIDRVLRENRWLLTRDGHLARRKVLRARHTVIASDDLEGQLRQLHRDLIIELEVNHQRGYRCADCNAVLTSISHDEVIPLVPPFVAQQYREFLQCPRCHRVFWPGTHWQDLLGRLAAAREEDAAGPR